MAQQTYLVWRTPTAYKFRWGHKVLEVPVTDQTERQLTLLLARWAEVWYNENPDEDPERNPDIAAD